MIFYKITFGTCDAAVHDEADDATGNFLGAIYQGGHISRAWHTMWHNGVMTAYVNATGPQAHLKRFFTQWAKDDLKKVVQHFGHEPQWECVDDDYRPRDFTWKNAPFLYLFTHLYDEESAVMRGDTGMPVPHYRMPISDEDRHDIFRWQAKYQDYDRIWIGSSTLEMPAYRELADLGSQLSEEGRTICQKIEAATGIPTYYYLQRYFGRKAATERERPCPGCGGTWATPFVDGEHNFWKFAFRCDACRLVSNMAYGDVNARYAKIGEPKAKVAEPQS